MLWNTFQQPLRSPRPKAPFSFLLPPVRAVCQDTSPPILAKFFCHITYIGLNQSRRTESLRWKTSVTSTPSLLEYLSDHPSIRKPEVSHEALTYIQLQCVRLCNRNQLTTSLGAVWPQVCCFLTTVTIFRVWTRVGVAFSGGMRSC